MNQQEATTYYTSKRKYARLQMNWNGYTTILYFLTHYPLEQAINHIKRERVLATSRPSPHHHLQERTKETE